MSFKKKTWVNIPDENNLPEIPEGQDSLAVFDADNMNRLEVGIEEAHNNKLDKSVYENNRNNDLIRTGIIESYIASGDLSCFKEFICSIPESISQFLGAINDKIFFVRYNTSYNSTYIYYIYTININTHEIEDFAQIPSNIGNVGVNIPVCSIVDENTIYVSDYYETIDSEWYHNGVLRFWRIDKGSVTPVQIKSQGIYCDHSSSSNTYRGTRGCVVKGDYIYMRVVDRNAYEEWIYKAPIDGSAGFTVELNTKYNSASAGGGFFLLSGEDICNNGVIYKNGDFTNGQGMANGSYALQPIFYDARSDMFLCNNGAIPLWKKDGYIPLAYLTQSVTYDRQRYIIYNGYLYVFINPFLFRTKISDTN